MAGIQAQGIPKVKHFDPVVVPIDMSADRQKYRDRGRAIVCAVCKRPVIFA
jgi:hypothetical protein